MSTQANGDGAGLSRRQFLKFSVATAGAAALLGGQAPAFASGGAAGDVPGMLIDVSRCVGCGNCQRSCVEANKLNPSPEQLDKLTAETFTAVDKYEVGDKTRWVKRQCMHCLEAACASACPVSALHKSPEGVIAYHADRCLGCRYCMVACPFGIPRFEWQDGLTPEIRKCMFCVGRLRDGEVPACQANCPSGALRFGKRDELLHEAKARLAAQPDRYVAHVFGEHEAGGTAMLYISDTPFEQMGFRTDVTTRPLPAYTWDVMTKLPAVIGSLAIVLTGTSILTRKRGGGHEEEPEWLHEDEK